MKKANGDDAQNLVILKRVLQEIADEKISCRAEVISGGALRLYLPRNDKPAQVRASSVSGNKAEHKVGFERFKISPSVRNYSFVIFAIEHSGNLAIYVFSASEIANLKSLNLRFTDESKYQITRKSKYDKAFRNWKVLK